MATIKKAPKKAAGKAALKTASKPARPVSDPEAIRVVPLHNPKAEVKLEDLGKETGDSELFTGKPEVWAKTPKLIYNGGPLIKNVKVFTIFWGKDWNSNASFTALKGKLNQFFTDILVSPLLDQLAEYSRPGMPIGHGSLIGTKTITASAPKSSVKDSHIQTTLLKWISAGTVPAWDANTLYFIYIDKGIKVTMGGSASCSSFCGYHNDIKGKTYYAVMPFPGCAGCLGGNSVFDALTGTSSHELSEAITDPVPATGWYDNANGEIGDICAWKFKKIGAYNIQLEWSNKAKACI
jgi:hypothetical protein